MFLDIVTYKDHLSVYNADIQKKSNGTEIPNQVSFNNSLIEY